MKYEEEAMQLFRPITDVFACSDGGVAYVRLRSILCTALNNVDNPNPKTYASSIEFVKTFEKLSMYSESLLKQTKGST